MGGTVVCPLPVVTALTESHGAFLCWASAAPPGSCLSPGDFWAPGQPGSWSNGERLSGQRREEGCGLGGGGLYREGSSEERGFGSCRRKLSGGSETVG